MWAFARRKPVGGVCLAILVFYALIAILGNVMAPQDPNQTDPLNKVQGMSREHPFGTDGLGRDVFSRVIVGTRLSYVVSISAILLSLFVGGVVAITSAYYGGRYDILVQRVVDVLMAFPTLILALAIMAVLGTSVVNVILAISISMAPRLSRVIRASALSIRETEYVMAAQALGATSMRVMWRHIAPNTFATAIIITAANLGAVVLTEASLSFLGLGIPPPAPAWGRDLSEAMRYWYEGPWLAVFPGLALSLFVLAANLLGDAMRDDLDPRLKRV